MRCGEDIARDLFFRPETIDYTLQWANGFIFLSLLGTVFLMTSVVALANAKIQLQIAWAAAYVLLNIAHWVAAALPRKLNWDFSIYKLTEQSVLGGPQNRSFTEALFKAILLTKDVRWVHNTKGIPQTPVWNEWLVEAETQAKQCGYYMAPLEDTMWSAEDGKIGRVWDSPAQWDPRAAWNRINDDHMASSQADVD